MHVVVLAIIGAAAGLIATKLMKFEANLAVTIAIGVLGALIGGLVLRGLVVMSGAAGGLIGAVLGAMLLIWLYRRFVNGRF